MKDKDSAGQQVTARKISLGVPSKDGKIGTHYICVAAFGLCQSFFEEKGPKLSSEVSNFGLAEDRLFFVVEGNVVIDDNFLHDSID